MQLRVELRSKDGLDAKLITWKVLMVCVQPFSRNREYVMDLEAIFGLESGSPHPPKRGTYQCLECPNTPADTDAAYEAFICRLIERDLGLPNGSLRLWAPRRPGA